MAFDAELLQSLTVRELLDTARNLISVPHNARQNKHTLVEHLLVNTSGTFESTVCNLVNARNERKRRAEEERDSRRVAQRMNDERQPEHDTNAYLALPTEAERMECNRAFYEATSNSAVSMAVCGVCARELGVHAEHMENVQLEDLQNRERLRPAIAHEAHDLYDGCLLHPDGVLAVPGCAVVVKTCKSCRDELAKEGDRGPPRLALANNLWVGRVPPELAELTVTEQMLIAQLYPRVYVYKLFPKGQFHCEDEDVLQRAMRGTVSTYDLSQDKIASMVDGGLMPQRPEVLANILTVTFIGAGPVPKKLLKLLFRVRRAYVARALLWLKANNPKYYGNINICEERLAALPEDDVPEEVIAVVRQCTDAGMAVQEGAGYVPEDNMIAVPGDGEQVVTVDDDAGPDVIPLHVSGSVDTDLSKMTANDLMMWGVVNLWAKGKEGAYRVQPGTTPVSDFGRPPRTARGDEGTEGTEGNGGNVSCQPNFFERAFPCLYPYGHGGIEGPQQQTVDFREHVQWALQYSDRRFRRHETFPFVAFGIQQRREALFSARLQMRRKTFDREAAVLTSISEEKLRGAKAREDAGLQVTDPAVLLLRQLVHGTASRVQGCDAQRYRIRGQIWSTCLIHGPPTVWMTINPSDAHDPIAQVFAGVAIDLDRFVGTVGPCVEERAKNIAQDPYAAAKFFHFLIDAIVTMLFGVTATQHTVKTSMGVLGRVSAYIGAVESQGRGALHLHMLAWLENTPRPEQLQGMLKTEEFQARVLAYIRANMRAYLPGLESAEALRAIPRDTTVSYCRPPDPSSTTYAEDVQTLELKLARTLQAHVCMPRRCLFPNRQGRNVCKRRAPFEYSEDDYVKEDGRWSQKRLYENMNGWIPSVLVNGRCNNDGKILTNGAETKNITFYVSSYAGKKQGKNFNMTAVLADGYAYHESHPKAEYVANLREQQRLMLFRLVHAINREQELAGPMVVSYLMGWGDTKMSHTYSPLYWGGFVGHLLTKFPQLRRTQAPDGATEANEEERERADERQPDHGFPAEDHDDEDGAERVTLDLGSNGRMFARSQTRDYAMRGPELERYSLWQFTKDTYESEMTAADRAVVAVREDARRGPGRPRNQRSKYLETHPCHAKKIRIVRSQAHRNIPNVIGKWFPRNDDEEVEEFYAASMLMLLKPWRRVESDLKMESERWTDAFQRFRAAATTEALAVIGGAQYFHECSLAAAERREAEEAADGEGSERRGHQRYPEDMDLEAELDLTAAHYTEEGLQALKLAAVNMGEYAHAKLALEAAHHAKFFAGGMLEWPVTVKTDVTNATGASLIRLAGWKTQLESTIESQRRGHEPPEVQTHPDGGDVRHEDGRLPQANAGVVEPELHGLEDALPPAEVAQLTDDQFRAYDIIAWHLEQTLSGTPVAPLRMIIYGEGGTGKSRVIQTVTETFAKLNASFMLVKAAYTGIAASLIDGKTMHVIARLSVNADGSMSDETKRQLQLYWRVRRYLVLDEYSMLAKSFVSRFERQLSVAMEGSDLGSTHSFGGLSVVLCGDLHQFPPVARAPQEWLFHTVNLATDKPDQLVGRRIYEEFQTVVILREQMRVTDPVWRDFLDHLRHGDVQAHHLQMLRGLVVGEPGMGDGTFDGSEWPSAALVTPRHAVRKEWNTQALRTMCQGRGRQVYKVIAEDLVQGRSLTMKERWGLAGRLKATNGNKKKDLPEEVELAIGMRVMVTSNIQTDLDLANGARGEIVHISLHPEEPPVGDEAVVKLRYVPPYVLVKMDRTRAGQLEGLDADVIPVEPLTQSMQIKLSRANGHKPVTRTVRRKQYPITGAYAFTDYRSQGQTIPQVVVDIKKPPPPGQLSLFNVYVALSRSRGRESIRLLWDFDDDVLLQHHDAALLVEDTRLELLDAGTKMWWEGLGRGRPAPGHVAQ